MRMEMLEDLKTAILLRLTAGGRWLTMVVLTEDWSVLAFDHELRPLWEHTLGSRGAADMGR